MDEASPMHLAERILAEIRRSSCRPHHRILSQRRLAARFETSQNTVFKAIALLREKGYVYTRGGSGVFLAEQAMIPAESPATGGNAAPGVVVVPKPRRGSAILPYVPALKTLRIAMLIYDDPLQVRMWTRVFDAFHREFPFVRLELDFSAKPAPAGVTNDVQFTCPVTLSSTPDAYQPLDLKLLAEAGFRQERLAAGLLDLGQRQTDGQLLGLPLLRNTTMLAANRALMAGSSFAGRPFRTPAEFFQAGHELDLRCGPHVQGFMLPSCPHAAALYGVTVRQTEPGHFTFPRDRMAAFLADLRSWARPESLFDHGDTLFQRFASERLGLYFHYWSDYPDLHEAVPELEPLPIPLRPDGFVCESVFLGSIPRESRHREEAMLLIGYLISEPAQTLLVQENPYWLSIDTEVLARQRRESPFPPGAVQYAFDPRSLYTQLNPIIYFDYWPRVATEVVKFLLGRQDMDAVLAKMERMERM